MNKKSNKELYENLKAKTDLELRELVYTKNSFVPEHYVAVEILEKRKFWKGFLTYGIVAWLALVLSIFNLWLQL
ncbi:hypothetical protein [Cerasicoccus arenae]|uniref:Uncharacterized protein n=1 Tax=Cerasicoccus arenae TaxID=424488 RepID=A0A8J3GDD0_9BACT|nr:hypothetical protein [Cerasicoccus arenae]MBK1859485.1 hypothetical protein [Cerasicoccus arenae]GHB94906.1 hypothetical protein GCM10007047_08070 [Cerasicoccus arenae]